MKILWHSVPALHKTGYGCQTRLWANALHEAGHEVVISSISGNDPTMVNSEGFIVLGQGTRQGYGNDFIRAHVNRIKPDVVISLMDTFVMDTLKIEEIVGDGTPWIGWQVVDSAPLMPRLKPTARIFTRNLVMSHFGERVLTAAGYDSEYVPLALDPSYYPMDWSEARADLSSRWEVSLPIDRPLVVMNAANMSPAPTRKNFAAGFLAFKKVLDVRPDALMYLHTEVTGNMSHGIDLAKTLEACRLTQDQVLAAPQYEYNMGAIGEDYLRTVYSAADCLLVPSMGEGFGLPIIEAQACGCPVVGTHCSAIPELVIDFHKNCVHGVNIETYPGTFQTAVDPEALARALIEALDIPPEGPREPLYQSMNSRFGLDTVVPMLEKVLEGVRRPRIKSPELTEAIP